MGDRIGVGREAAPKLEFGDYDSLEDSCRDYAWLITNGAPYRAGWERYEQHHDLHALTRRGSGRLRYRSRLRQTGRR